MNRVCFRIIHSKLLDWKDFECILLNIQIDLLFIHFSNKRILKICLND